MKFRILVLVALTLATGLSAQTVTLKIASIAPEKSPYGDALHQMAAAWAKITNGKVKLVMYFSGVAGEEFDIVRKMRLGQLQGGMLSQMGLSFIDRRTNVLTAPQLVKNDDELDYVLERMKPTFDQYLLEKKVVPIAYSRAGWLRFFSKSDQIRTPTEVAQRKLGISGTEKDFFEAFKRLDFNVVPVEVSESLSALNTGLADTTFSSPMVVGPLQWFGIENHMLDLKISPFIGAFVIDQKAWDKVPVEFRAPMLKAAQDLASKTMNDSIVKLENDAIATMVSYGLVLVKPTPAETKQWTDRMEAALPMMAEYAFDKATLEKAKAILATYPGAKK